MSDTPETALECAFALLKCSPIGNPENSSEYGRAAYILSEHCQGQEDVSEAAMRIFAERIAELERERDEAREAFVIATDQMVQAQCKTREALRERDEAMAEIQRLRLDAQREAEQHDRMVKELEGLYDQLAKTKPSNEHICSLNKDLMGNCIICDG